MAEEVKKLAGTIGVNSIKEVANLKINSELQTQLAIYYLLFSGIPLKNKLMAKATMIEALNEAIVMTHDSSYNKCSYITPTLSHLIPLHSDENPQWTFYFLHHDEPAVVSHNAQH